MTPHDLSQEQAQGKAREMKKGPHADCHHCHGTGECSNAQFLCMCRHHFAGCALYKTLGDCTCGVHPVRVSAGAHAFVGCGQQCEDCGFDRADWKHVADEMARCRYCSKWGPCADHSAPVAKDGAAPVLPADPLDDARRDKQRIEQLEADLTATCQAREEAERERDEARLQLAWRAGSASELSKLLKEIVQWVKCDRNWNGPGPSGGYETRLMMAEAALGLWLAAEEKVQRAEAAEALRDRLRGYVQHKAGCGHQLTGGQLVCNSMNRGKYPPIVPACTCGLAAALSALPPSAPLSEGQ